MKRVIKKSWRGLTGLFVLKIGVICLLLTIHACSDAIEPKINFDQTAIDEYESFINRGVFNSSFGNSANLEVEEMSESQAKEVLSDFTDQSMKFLIGIGFDKSTIDSELGGVNSPNTAAIAYIILEEIKKDKSSASYFDLNS